MLFNIIYHINIYHLLFILDDKVLEDIGLTSPVGVSFAGAAVESTAPEQLNRGSWGGSWGGPTNGGSGVDSSNF